MLRKTLLGRIRIGAILLGSITGATLPMGRANAFKLNTCWSGIACLNPGELFVNMNDSFFYISGLIALAIFLLGAFRMVISAGNDSSLQEAKGLMKGALIGIALIAGSFGIYRTVVFWLHP